MAVRRRTLVYRQDQSEFEGIVAYDDAATAPRPGVLVVHNVFGQGDATAEKAEQLAELGYVGFACDLYGRGKRTTPASERPAEFMDALNQDRDLLLRRLTSSLSVVRDLPEVDASRLAAIGFCFGGKGVLDLARSGNDVAGVVSFHGVYDRPGYATASPMRCKVLVCHGWDDPLAPPDAVVGLAEELTVAEADWQLHAYGRTGHAFTGPPSGAPARVGFGFQPDSDRRSWEAMRGFLSELFPAS